MHGPCPITRRAPAGGPDERGVGSAAQLMTYHSAWLSDTEGATPNTDAALFRAKHMVGEAVAEVTRAD